MYLDTHVVVWLYAGRIDQLPPAVQQRIEEEDLLISPMVTLELQYLHEIGRTLRPGADVIEDLAGRIGLRVCPLPFHQVVAVANNMRWTRDPFDRMIVGHASAAGHPLLTKDEHIRAHFAGAWWT